MTYQFNESPRERKIKFAKASIELFYLPYCNKEERKNWWYWKGIVDGSEFNT